MEANKNVYEKEYRGLSSCRNANVLQSWQGPQMLSTCVRLNTAIRGLRM